MLCAEPLRSRGVHRRQRPAGRAAQRRQHRRAEDRDGHGGGDRAAGVEAARRGQQGVDREALEVLRQRGTGHEVQRALVPGHRDAQRERPAREVHQQPEGVRRHHAVRRQHHDLVPSGDAARQQPGAHPDPGRDEHLVRQPRADPGGHQRRREQRRAAEREAEAGAEHPAAEDQQEEHQLHAGGAGRQPAQHGVAGASSTPRIASARGSRPPSETSASTTAITSGSSARNRNGGLSVSPSGSADEQRPAQHHQPGHGRHAQDGGGAAGQRDGGGSSRGHGVHSRATTSSTRSHGEPSTLVTCGAKAGDSATTRRTGPDETTSPSASTTTWSATWATNSTSWVATRTALPSAARPERRGERVLGGVVEPPRRLVEEQHGGRAGEHDGQREREALTLGQVAGWVSSSMPGTSRVEVARPSRPRSSRSSSATVSR